MKKNFLLGATDVLLAFSRLSLAWMLAWQDIKLRYRRSKLGPFWITISTGVMVWMIALIFSQALTVNEKEYIPFVTCGIIFWGFISICISESCQAFSNSAAMIKQLDIPLSLYLMQVIIRNIIVLVHNIIIIPLSLLAVKWVPSLTLFWLIPGGVLLLINIFWISLTLSVICTRFRDMPPIVASLIQVFFYVTPIIWMPNVLNVRTASMIVDNNPFFHFLELLRAPIMGSIPSSESWLFVGVLALIGTAFSVIFFGKYKTRIAYWI